MAEIAWFSNWLIKCLILNQELCNTVNSYETTCCKSKVSIINVSFKANT